MKLYITDTYSKYSKSLEKNKLLLEGAIIKKSSFISDKDVAHFNHNTNAIENLAGECMLSELYETSEKLLDKPFYTNKFIQKISNSTEKHFALLYSFFSNHVFKKYLLKLVIERLLLNNFFVVKVIILDFSDTSFYLCTSFFSSNFKNIIFENHSNNKHGYIKKKIKYLLKNIFFIAPHYIFKKITNGSLSKVPKSKNHILLLIYDMPHHFEVLKTFFHLITEKKDVHLSVVIFKSSDYPIPNNELINESKNITIYNFEKFRKPYSVFKYSTFLNIVEQIKPDYKLVKLNNYMERQELLYNCMENIFTTLKPDVCFQMTVHDIGRVMASVANFNQTPCLQVDYALFSENYTMESRIKFSARVSINQAMIDVWKKRHDPTEKYFVNGFCKLDTISSPNESKKDFYKKYFLDYTAKTILFTSTYSNYGQVYDMEKEILIGTLSDICYRNKWNFIIKKHPLEKDKISNNTIKKNIYKFQKVFEHENLPLSEAIFYSDFVVNQMSSIVLECLYFEKPFVYITSSNTFSQTESSIFKNETFVQKININEAEKYIIDLLSDVKKMEETIKMMRAKKEEYLHLTDGKASKRLLNILLDYANTRPTNKKIKTEFAA